jgi:hypothetical protein
MLHRTRQQQPKIAARYRCVLVDDIARGTSVRRMTRSIICTGSEHKRTPTSQRVPTLLPRIYPPNAKRAFGGKSMKTRVLNRKLAKQDPEGTFDSPLDIVDERLFTRGEKVATLNRWRQTALSASVSVDTHRLLQLIDEAKGRLGA